MQLDAAATAALDADAGLGDFWSKLGDTALTYGGAVATGYATGDFRAALQEAQAAKAAKDKLTNDLAIARQNAAAQSPFQQIASTLGISSGASTSSTGAQASGAGGSGSGSGGAGVNKGLLIGGAVAAVSLLVLVIKE